MKRVWGIWVHVALLGVASTTAWFMSARTVEPNLTNGPAFDVWRVEAEQVQSIVLETPERRVTVEPKHDSVGNYALVSLENQAKSEHSDAGAADKTVSEKKRFISVDGAEKVRQGLARFRALLTIGKVDAKRATDFGLDKPEGTLRVGLVGDPRVLTIGASTPGGGNYYARDEKTGLVHVVVGEPIATLMYAEGRMVERDLHGFKTDEATRIAVQAGGKRRQLVRVANRPNGWADTDSASKEDETASNWVGKLMQLRVTSYEEKFQNTPTPIVRVEYADTKTNLGFIEIFKVQGSSDSTRYVVKSERSRWFAEVMKSQAEQLERDVSLIAK
jgi:hypothetical protein